MNPEVAEIVFRESPKRIVFCAPGHKPFVTAADGKEPRIFYHANTGPGQVATRAKFSWTVDGRPDFGKLEKVDSVLTVPASEP